MFCIVSLCMKILAVGDIHLGRRPARLPRELDAEAFGAGEAWRLTVAEALRQGVTAVLLAGDVVDRERDLFEAYRELARGVRELTDAGIRVLGVAGNHDVEVLPRLADELPEFTLLGRGGRWQSVQLEDGAERVTVWGWSFPQPRVIDSPLAAADSPAAAGFDPGPGVHLGLLHCDRDQSVSPYAPVAGAELAAAPFRGWLLGHIHRPDPLTVEDLSGYLGSLGAAHPGEAGPRGPWLLTVGRGAVRAVEHLPLAPLRYLPLAVDLSGIGGVEEGRARILAAVRELDEGLVGAGRVPRAVALRLFLEGRSRFGHPTDEGLSESDREALFEGREGTRYFIEQVVVDTRTEVDLAELALREDPVGELARHMLVLDSPEEDPQRQALLREARQIVLDHADDSAWGLRPAATDDEQVVNDLQRCLMKLMDLLLDQEARGVIGISDEEVSEDED